MNNMFKGQNKMCARAYAHWSIQTLNIVPNGAIEPSASPCEWEALSLGTGERAPPPFCRFLLSAATPLHLILFWEKLLQKPLLGSRAAES